MCGIYAYLSAVGRKLSPDLITKIDQAGMLIQHRGPDNTKTLSITDRLHFGFHRLAINGLNHESDEPLIYEKSFLICNGEIYNCHDLIQKYDLPVQTENDCEVILHLYKQFGIRKTIESLDGEFAFILYDGQKNELYLGTDPIGVRPLFRGKTKSGDLAWASEPIALRDICEEGVDFFPPGCYQKIDLSGKVNDPVRYFNYSWTLNKTEPSDIYPKLRELFENAVRKRLMSDRPIACLLSGGLDSSLVSALVAKFLAVDGKKLHTFSIGLEGSPDLFYAQKVSDHIGSIHHPILVTEQDFLSVIPQVIKAIGSWDITTVRASVGNYLLGKYIKENTDFKVIFNGDGSEEIWSSYFYSRFAPSDFDFHQDNIKLLKEVHRYDVLRSARCMEHFGLEARPPFLDKKLINYVMSIHPKYKRFGPDCLFNLEKMLIRNTFQDLLPPDIIWRPKTAFSDGVSKKEKSWHQIVTEWINTQVSDQEYINNKSDCFLPEPISKEAYFYRKVFIEQLGKRADMVMMIGDYWMPRFIKATDPSAREIGASS